MRKRGALSLWKAIMLVIFGLVAVAGATVLSIYVSGGFDEKKVNPEDMSFSTEIDEGLGSYNADTGRYEVASDFKMTISTTTEDVTATNVELSLANGRKIKKDEKWYVTDGVITVPLQVKLNKAFSVQIESEYSQEIFDNIIVGGNSLLTAKSENKLLEAKSVNIFVDVPVYEIKTKIAGSTQTGTVQEVVVGSEFGLETTFVPEKSQYMFSDTSADKKIVVYSATAEGFIRYDEETGKFYAEQITGDNTATITAYTFANAYYQSQFLKQNSGASDLKDLIRTYFRENPTHCVSCDIQIKVLNAEISSVNFSSQNETFEGNFDKKIRVTAKSGGDKALGVSIKDSKAQELSTLYSNIGIKLVKGLEISGGSLMKVDKSGEETTITRENYVATKNYFENASVIYYLLPNTTPTNPNYYYWDFSASEGENFEVKLNFFFENNDGKMVNFFKFDEEKSFNFKFSAKTDEGEIGWKSEDEIELEINFKEDGNSNIVKTPAHIDLSELVGEISEDKVYKTVKYFLYCDTDVPNGFVMTEVFDCKGGVNYTISEKQYTLYELEGSILTAFESFEGKVYVVAAIVKTNADNKPYLDKDNKYNFVGMSNAKEVIVRSNLSIYNMTPSFEIEEDASVTKDEQIYVPAINRDDSGLKKSVITFKLVLESSDFESDAQKVDTAYADGKIKVECVDRNGNVSADQYVSIESLVKDNDTDKLSYTGSLSIKEDLFKAATNGTDEGKYVRLQLRFNDGKSDYTQIIKDKSNNDHFFIYYQQPVSISSAFENNNNFKEDGKIANVIVNIKSNETSIKWGSEDIAGEDLEGILEKLNKYLETEITDQYGKKIETKDGIYSIKLVEDPGTGNNKIINLNTDGNAIIGFSSTTSSKETCLMIEVVDNAGNFVLDEASKKKITFSVESEGISKVKYDITDIAGTPSYEESESITNVKVSKYVTTKDVLTLSNLVKVYTGSNTEEASESIFFLDESSFSSWDLQTKKDIMLMIGFNDDGTDRQEETQTNSKSIDDYLTEEIEKIKIINPFGKDTTIGFLVMDKDKSLYRISLELEFLADVGINSTFESYYTDHSDYLTKDGTKLSIVAGEKYDLDNYLKLSAKGTKTTDKDENGNLKTDESGNSIIVNNSYSWFAAVKGSGVEEIKAKLIKVDNNDERVILEKSENKLCLYVDSESVFQLTTIKVTIYYGVQTNFAASQTLTFLVHPDIIIRQKENPKLTLANTDSELETFYDAFSLVSFFKNECKFDNLDLKEIPSPTFENISDKAYITLDSDGKFGVTTATLQIGAEEYVTQQFSVKEGKSNNNLIIDAVKLLYDGTIVKIDSDSEVHLILDFQIGFGKNITEIFKIVGTEEYATSISSNGKEKVVLFSGKTYSSDYLVDSFSGRYFSKNGEKGVSVTSIDNFMIDDDENAIRIKMDVEKDENTLTVIVSIPVYITRIGENYVYYSNNDNTYNTFEKVSLDVLTGEYQGLVDNEVFETLEAGKTYNVVHDTEKSTTHASGFGFRGSLVGLENQEGATYSLSIVEGEEYGEIVGTDQLKIYSLTAGGEDAYIGLKLTFSQNGYTFSWFYRIKVKADATLEDVSYPFSEDGEYLDVESKYYDGEKYVIDFAEQFQNTANDGKTRFGKVEKVGELLANAISFTSEYRIKEVMIDGVVTTDFDAYFTYEFDGSKLIITMLTSNSQIDITVERILRSLVLQGAGQEQTQGDKVVGSEQTYTLKFGQGKTYKHTLSKTTGSGETADTKALTADGNTYTTEISAGSGEIILTPTLQITNNGTDSPVAGIRAYVSSDADLSNFLKKYQQISAGTEYFEKDGETISSTAVGTLEKDVLSFETETIDKKTYVKFDLEVTTTGEDGEETTQTKTYYVLSDNLEREYFYLDEQNRLHICPKNNVTENFNAEIGFYPLLKVENKKEYYDKVAFRLDLTVKGHYAWTFNSGFVGGKTYDFIKAKENVNSEEYGIFSSITDLLNNGSYTLSLKVTTESITLDNAGELTADKLVNIDNENNKVTFAHLTQDVTFKFTATITDSDNETFSFDFEITVKKSVTLTSKTITDSHKRYGNVEFKVGEGSDSVGLDVIADKFGFEQRIIIPAGTEYFEKTIDKNNQPILNKVGEISDGTTKEGFETETIGGTKYVKFNSIETKENGTTETKVYYVEYDKVNFHGDIRFKDVESQYSLTITPQNVAVDGTGVTETINMVYWFEGECIYGFSFNFTYYVYKNVTVTPNYPKPDGENSSTAEYIEVQVESDGACRSDYFENFFDSIATFATDNRFVVKEVEGLEGIDFGREYKIEITEIENATIQDTSGKVYSKETLATSKSMPNLNIRFILSDTSKNGRVVFTLTCNEVSAEYEVILVNGSVISVETHSPNYDNNQETIYAEDLATMSTQTLFESDRIMSATFSGKGKATKGATYYVRFLKENTAKVKELKVTELGKEINVELGESLTGYLYDGTYQNENNAKDGISPINDEEYYESVPKLTARIVAKYKDGSTIKLTDDTTLELITATKDSTVKKRFAYQFKEGTPAGTKVKFTFKFYSISTLWRTQTRTYEVTCTDNKEYYIDTGSDLLKHQSSQITYAPMGELYERSESGEYEVTTDTSFEEGETYYELIYTYKVTTDTSFEEGKTYYEKTESGEYKEITSFEEGKSYYERSESYQQTTDTSFAEGKTYYEKAYIYNETNDKKYDSKKIYYFKDNSGNYIEFNVDNILSIATNKNVTITEEKTEKANAYDVDAWYTEEKVSLGVQVKVGDTTIKTSAKYNFYIDVEFGVENATESVDEMHIQEIVAGTSNSLFGSYNNIFGIKNTRTGENYTKQLMAQNSGNFELFIYGFDGAPIKEGTLAYEIHNKLKKDKFVDASGNEIIYSTGLNPRASQEINGDGYVTGGDQNNNYITLSGDQKITKNGVEVDTGKTLDYAITAQGCSNDGNYVMMKIVYTVKVAKVEIVKEYNIMFKVVPGSSTTVQFKSSHNATSSFNPGNTEFDKDEHRTITSNNNSYYVINKGETSFNLWTNNAEATGFDVGVINAFMYGGTSINSANKFTYTYTINTPSGYNDFGDLNNTLTPYNNDSGSNSWKQVGENSNTYKGNPTTNDSDDEQYKYLSLKLPKLNLGERYFVIEGENTFGYKIKFYFKLVADLNPEVESISSTTIEEGNYVGVGVRYQEVETTKQAPSSDDNSDLYTVYKPVDYEIGKSGTTTKYKLDSIQVTTEAGKANYSVIFRVTTEYGGDNEAYAGTTPEWQREASANDTSYSLYNEKDKNDGWKSISGGSVDKFKYYNIKTVTLWLKCTKGSDGITPIYSVKAIYKDEKTNKIEVDIKQSYNVNSTYSTPETSGLGDGFVSVLLKGIDAYAYNKETETSFDTGSALTSQLYNLKVTAIDYYLQDNTWIGGTGDEYSDTTYQTELPEKSSDGADLFTSDSFNFLKEKDGGVEIVAGQNAAGDDHGFVVPKINGIYYGTGNTLSNVKMRITLKDMTQDDESKTNEAYLYYTVTLVRAASSEGMFKSTNIEDGQNIMLGENVGTEKSISSVLNDTLEVKLDSGASVTFVVSNEEITEKNIDEMTRITKTNNRTYAITEYVGISASIDGLENNLGNEKFYISIVEKTGNVEFEYNGSELKTDVSYNSATSFVENKTYYLKDNEFILINSEDEFNKLNEEKYIRHEGDASGSIENYKENITLNIENIAELNNSNYKTETLFFLFKANNRTYQHAQEFRVYPNAKSAEHSNIDEQGNYVVKVEDYLKVSNGTNTYYVTTLNQWAKEIKTVLYTADSKSVGSPVGFFDDPFKYEFEINTTISGGLGSAFIDERGAITTSEDFVLESHTITVNVYQRVSGDDGLYQEANKKLKLAQFRLYFEQVKDEEFIVPFETENNQLVYYPNAGTITLTTKYKIDSENSHTMDNILVIPNGYYYSVPSAKTNNVSSAIYEIDKGNNVTKISTSFACKVGETVSLEELVGDNKNVVESNFTYHMIKVDDTLIPRGNIGTWTFSTAGQYEFSILVTGRDSKGNFAQEIVTGTMMVYDTSTRVNKSVLIPTTGENGSYNLNGNIGEYDWYELDSQGNITQIEGGKVSDLPLGKTTRQYLASRDDSFTIYNITYYVYRGKAEKSATVKSNTNFSLSNLPDDDREYEFLNIKDSYKSVTGYKTTKQGGNTENVTYFVIIRENGEITSVEQWTVTYYIVNTDTEALAGFVSNEKLLDDKARELIAKDNGADNITLNKLESNGVLNGLKGGNSSVYTQYTEATKDNIVTDANELTNGKYLLSDLYEFVEYEATADTSFVSGKTYYEKTTDDGTDTYSVTTDEELKEDKTYYEKVDKYVKTEDKEVVAGKTYYYATFTSIITRTYFATINNADGTISYKKYTITFYVHQGKEKNISYATTSTLYFELADLNKLVQEEVNGEGIVGYYEFNGNTLREVTAISLEKDEKLQYYVFVGGQYYLINFKFKIVDLIVDLIVDETLPALTEVASGNIVTDASSVTEGKYLLSDLYEFVGYEATADTSFVSGKTYYEKTTDDGTDTYSVTTDEELKEDKTYYEKVDKYVKTEDKEVVAGKTYYRLTNELSALEDNIKEISGFEGDLKVDFAILKDDGELHYALSSTTIDESTTLIANVRKVYYKQKTGSDGTTVSYVETTDKTKEVGITYFTKELVKYDGDLVIGETYYVYDTTQEKWKTEKATSTEKENNCEYYLESFVETNFEMKYILVNITVKGAGETTSESREVN